MSVVVTLLQKVEDSAQPAQGQRKRLWHETPSIFRNLFVEAIPLSAIRIVVVVLQIVIQVSALRASLKPIGVLV